MNMPEGTDAPYEGPLNDAAQFFADSQYRTPIVNAELNALQLEHFNLAGVSMDKLYDGSADERKAEWKKVDTKKLAEAAADLAAKRLVMTHLGSYKGDWEADTEKFRKGELEGEALKGYQSMAALLRSTGYNPEAFANATENLIETRNLSTAVSRNIQTMSGWKANAQAEDLNTQAQRNYEDWKLPDDNGPLDLTRRLNREIDRRARSVLDNLLS
jgi:hypothetical protein